MLQSLLFNYLVQYDEEFNIVPDLAERWEVSADARVWTFYLRRDVYWHDGVPFTAEDVRFTLESIANPDVTAYMKAYLQDLEEVTALDKWTVRVRFKKPFGSLLQIQ